MNKEKLLKKIDKKINYLKGNNIQQFKLEKYINDLCNSNNVYKNHSKALVMQRISQLVLNLKESLEKILKWIMEKFLRKGVLVWTI